jgi:hypothetical protein
MEVQWFFRLGTLIAVPVDKLIEDLKKNMDELEPQAHSWTMLKFVRQTAINCIPDIKETRIKWLTTDSMEYNDPLSGKKTVVTRQNMCDLNNHFATMAEGILTEFDVPCLTKEQIAAIIDPLSSSGDAARISLLTFNDTLATQLSASTSIVVKDLDKLSTLHTCVTVRGICSRVCTISDHSASGPCLHRGMRPAEIHRGLGPAVQQAKCA